MTEFALIIPVFLLVVAGLLGFGRVFFYWIETNHDASETARWAVVDRNPYLRPGCVANHRQPLSSHRSARHRRVDSRVPDRHEGLHRLPRRRHDRRSATRSRCEI